MTFIRFTKEAFLDIEDAALWYEHQRQGLSFDFELCLEVGIQEISRTPLAFQKKYKQVYVRFINRFPYGIHYIIKNDLITVIGVFHTSRSPKDWSSRIL